MMSKKSTAYCVVKTLIVISSATHAKRVGTCCNRFSDVSYWNRDTNGALNILKITLGHITNNERPINFQRCN